MKLIRRGSLEVWLDLAHQILLFFFPVLKLKKSYLLTFELQILAVSSGHGERKRNLETAHHVGGSDKLYVSWFY